MVENNNIKLLVAAGGTGGHLFPAIAVVQKLEKLTENDIQVIFVGTSQRMESKIIPELGYKYHSMPIEGFKGIFSPGSWTLPLKILKSIKICRKIIKEFKTDAVLCTGAYISYPAGAAAYKEKTPLILMESNVNPGKTIKMLATKAEFLITSFEETERYFKNIDKSKIKCFGNPVRESLFKLPEKKKAREKFGLKQDIDTVLVFGGSLGALSINQAIEDTVLYFKNKNIQFLWQTGKEYKPKSNIPENVRIVPFIEDMASAYSSADLVVSRSGAATVAELAVCGKPSILIPLPSASNDEQAQNARIFQKNNAAILLSDNEVQEKITDLINENINDKNRLEVMANAAKSLAKPNAAEEAAKIILELIDAKS
ncbi:undecaprenyldiphospho-muramoylpentapeptide beta-N-acetylglucosaminyltransferase [Bacteroidota bacterium]